MEKEKEKEKEKKKNIPHVKGRKAQIANLLLAIIDSFDNTKKN